MSMCTYETVKEDEEKDIKESDDGVKMLKWKGF